MKKFNFNFFNLFKKSKAEDALQKKSIISKKTFDGIQEFPRPRHDGVEDFATFSENDESTKTDVGEASYSEPDEDRDALVEKTLSRFNLDKFKNENKDFDESDSDKTDPAIVFQEMGAPKKSGLSIKFPKFGKKGGNDEEDRLKKTPSYSSGKIFEKLSWNDIVLKIFSPYTRVKVHGIFVILLVVTLTYVFGKSIALFIGRSTPVVSNVKSNITVPIEKTDTAAADLNKITSANLFNVKESDKSTAVKTEKKDISSVVCTDAEKPTAEPLKLLDTIVLQDTVKSVASVQVRGSSDLFNVREGEQLNGNMEVAKINRMKIILKNLTTGECEYIGNEEDENPAGMPNIRILSPKKAQAMFKSTMPEIRNVGNNFKIKRKLRDKMISNMSEVLTQAKAIQITNPDGSLSFKMTEVVPGSIYSNLNIQNDDIITSINGKKIENLNELMGLLGKIKEIDQFQLGRKRNGLDETLDFGFE